MNRVIAVSLLVGGLVACKSDQDIILTIDGSIATTAGDFDDVAAPFNRMVVAHDDYEGLISTATWDDEYDAANIRLKVEDLIGEGNDIANHQLVVVASGTRGLGARAYNGLEPDDRFVADEDALARTRALVKRGGVLMTTDWAYDLPEQAWPDFVDYLGDDNAFDDAQTGEIADVTATVAEQELADALGMEQLVLRYDFSNWGVIESVDDDVTVWLRGDVQYRLRDGSGVMSLPDVPLLVSFQPEGGDKGTVVVSTFHLDAQTPAVIEEILRTVLGDLDEQADAPVEPIQ